MDKEGKKGMTFIERYRTDPEFKERHKKYISEKIECECGREVQRVGLYTHRKSKIHKKALEDMERYRTDPEYRKMKNMENYRKKRQDQQDKDLRKIIDELLNEKMKDLIKKE